MKEKILPVSQPPPTTTVYICDCCGQQYLSKAVCEAHEAGEKAKKEWAAQNPAKFRIGDYVRYHADGDGGGSGVAKVTTIKPCRYLQKADYFYQYRLEAIEDDDDDSAGVPVTRREGALAFVMSYEAVDAEMENMRSMAEALKDAYHGFDVLHHLNGEEARFEIIISKPIEEYHE